MKQDNEDKIHHADDNVDAHRDQQENPVRSVQSAICLRPCYFSVGAGVFEPFGYWKLEVSDVPK